MRASRWIGVAYCLLAGGAAILPWLQVRLGLNLPAYSVSGALLFLTLLAVVWYTVFTYELLEHSKLRDDQIRKTRRRSVASGLLTELKTVETFLRQVHEHLGSARDWDLRHPVLDNALEHLDLFEPSTARRIAAFGACLADLELDLRKLASLENASYPPAGIERFREEVTYKIHFPIAVIPELVESLRTEGGEMPPAGTPTITYQPGRRPTLPDSPFGRFDPVRGWLEGNGEGAT